MGTPLYDAFAMERADESARPAVIGMINGMTAGLGFVANIRRQMAVGGYRAPVDPDITSRVGSGLTGRVDPQDAQPQQLDSELQAGRWCRSRS